MSTKQNNTGELSDQQLDDVSGGQQVVKMEKIVVTAKRSDVNAPQQVVKMEKVVVTARRDEKGPADLSGAQIAQAEPGKK